ncbi:class C sortase [Peptoniphilus indolicus]|uniref:Sortase SrtD n=2 Tax=Peptoniphilus indolicus TaxID=33030 RepID=G4D2U7_9FIRM|nr:class C sortase [Peptoniphilus indolicus]EGY80144.1 sortase SrtD [Peptoniphilus indolicus ATCC 29427]SUB75187.1 Sortase (surface protein transpeptidase) [Peptoniphilus indolicus]
MTNKKKNRKILGYILILLGIAIPLYGFTGISKNIFVNKSEYNSFSKRVVSDEERQLQENKIEVYNQNLQGKEITIVDPFATDKFNTKYEISEDPDEIFAYLKIPKLDLVQPIRLDASNKHMAEGVAHVDGTSLPVGGVNNRSVIAGHRGYYQSIMFLNLDELTAGDKIFIERNGESLEYEVKDKEIINPSEWEKLIPIIGKDMVTLLTCDPFLPPRPHRLLVNCERVVSVPENTEEVKVEKNSQAKFIKYGSLGITLFGWIWLIFVGIKFFKFLKRVK